jgi:hypothetical protein
MSSAGDMQIGVRLMARLKGGSPHNKNQGQYWVRRHLDAQRGGRVSGGGPGGPFWLLFVIVIVIASLVHSCS